MTIMFDAGAPAARQTQRRVMRSRLSRAFRRSGVLVVALGLLAPAVVVGSTVLADAATCGLSPVTASMNNGDAPGTEQNPYDIALPEDLDRIAECDGPDVFFRQTADLELAGTTYTSAVVAGDFTGTYDGSGFMIRGLTIDAQAAGLELVGLFATLKGASVRDVYLIGASVSVVGPGAVGALTGLADGSTIQNVFVTGRVSVSCSSACDSAGVFIGGVAGFAQVDSLIQDVEFSGSVETTGSPTDGLFAAGGIVGYSVESSLERVSSFGIVSSPGNAGGVVGVLSDSQLIEALFDGTVRGAVTGDTKVGGAVGQAFNAFLAQVRARGIVEVEGDDTSIGGIVGQSEDSAMFRVGFVGEVRTLAEGGSHSSGGVAGFVLDGIIVEASVIGAVRSLEGWTGGILGEMVNGVIADSFAQVTLEGAASNLGGIAGSLVANADGDTSCPAGSHEATGAVGTYVFRTWSAASDSSGTTIPLAGRAIIPLGGAPGCMNFADAFWESATEVISTAGAPRSSAQMRAISTYTDVSNADLAAAWPIVAGLSAAVSLSDSFPVLPRPGSQGTVWGICAGSVDGYPFLLWETEGRTEADVCSVTTTGSGTTGSGSGPDLTCATLPATVGALVTCVVTGGPPGIDILWRAAYNPPFAGEGVTLDAAGSGEFSFTVPAAALGEPVTVELVDWLAPIPLGVAGGPVPASVPAGGGPAVPTGLAALMVLAVPSAIVVVRRRARIG